MGWGYSNAIGGAHMGNVTGAQVKSVIASYAKNNSVLETAKETGISSTAIGNCVRGLSKTAGGFHWECSC